MSQSSSNPFAVTIKAAPTQPAVNVPAWVPPAGYFADVPMLNNPAEVAPALYAGDGVAMNVPFITWGGSAVLRDFSPLGAQVYYSGGHESSAGQPNVQYTLICDFSSLKWSVANVPPQVNLPGVFVNGYAPDGSPYCPHSYLGLQEMPAAWGGAAKGTLVSFFWAGSNFDNRINLMDVSRPTGGYSKLSTKQAQNADPSRIRFSALGADKGSYPITVQDEARQGWWATVSGYSEYTLFISKTGAITQYPPVGGNMVNGSLVLCPSLNLLVGIDGGYSSGPNAGKRYRSMYMMDLATSKITSTLSLGTVPGLSEGYDAGGLNFHRPDGMGLQWVEALGCIVGLDQSQTPPVIVRLTPPASNPATGSWTWSTQAVQHWPQDSGGQAELQTVQNNYYSKFHWVPTLQAFVYATAKNRKPQVIRL